MEFQSLHRWDIPPKEAIVLQNELASKVLKRRDFGEVKTIAGADIAIDKERQMGIAGIVVFSYPELCEIERVCVKAPLLYPYIPGLLSFREGPVLLDAFEKLKTMPDIIVFDGQGIAHPRSFGLASHMGLWLKVPSIGCAKSLLVGEHEEPGKCAGDWKPLALRRASVVGAALRTRVNCKPVYVSIGHRIDLESAIKIVMSCVDKTRIPKPTREADKLVGLEKKTALTHKLQTINFTA